MDLDVILFMFLGTSFLLILLYFAIRLTIRPQSKLQEKQSNQKVVLKLLKMFYVMDNLKSLDDVQPKKSVEQ